MSRRGILVAWTVNGLMGALPKPGDVLSIDIELPANHSFGRRCMHCQTVVSRVSAGEQGEPMVAMQVSQMQFRSYNSGDQSYEASQDAAQCSVM